MERIASFCVDHTRLDRGIYLSRQDGDVLTWDIRMKKPNHGDYLSTGAAHTLEHLFATYARNSRYKDGVIYVGPMGCRTGFYLLTRGLTPAEALSLTVESFRFMAAFEGDVPGASEVECGNYRVSTGRKELRPRGASRKVNGNVILPATIHDFGNGRDYKVDLGMSPSGESWKVTSIANMAKLVSRLQKEAAE